MRVLIEACVADLASVRAAVAGGADRLELNRDLERDGLTPAADALREVRRVAPVPIIAMVRPHDRGYVYDDDQIDEMCREIRRFRALGADGVAAGVLDPEGRVDRSRLARLRQAATGVELVFHRAFDAVPRQGREFESLIDAGVDRVLTSGGCETAEAGVPRIAELVARAAGRIEILPGAGVDPENAASILTRTGCTQIHGTFRHPRAPDAGTDEDVVRRLRRAVDALEPASSRPRPAGPSAGILRDERTGSPPNRTGEE